MNVGYGWIKRTKNKNKNFERRLNILVHCVDFNIVVSG